MKTPFLAIVVNGTLTAKFHSCNDYFIDGRDEAATVREQL